MCGGDDTCHVLVVDDDRAIREILADLLAEEGFSVITAGNGQEALDKLRTGTPRPCAILLDLMMPIMSGLQFCAERRRDPALAEIPVIAISADHSLRGKLHLEPGEYLPKPLRFESVLTVVRRYCPSQSEPPRTVS
jgi:CheY-like chemotaxis protein